MHHKSKKFRQLIKMIHPVYEGPYQIKEEIRPNAYLVQDLEGRVIGVYNARQLRSHRDPEYKKIGCVCDSSNNEYSSDNNRNSTEFDESTKAQLPRVNRQEIKPIKTILKKTDNTENKNKKLKQQKSVQIENDAEYHLIDYSPEGQSNDEEPIPRCPEQQKQKFQRMKEKSYEERHLKQKKGANRVKEKNCDICVLELMEVDEKSSTSNTSNTMDLLDMPEGEPDDESVVFPNSPVMFSEKYREAILVLDCVRQKPEIVAEIASYEFKLRLDDNNELNLMSKDLYECLLQQPESVSQTKLTNDPVINLAPAGRMIRTNLTVAGHMESFVIIEDTALIIAAIGKTTITKILPYIASSTKFSGTSSNNETHRDNILHTLQSEENSNRMAEEYKEWLSVQEQLDQMLKYEKQLKQTLKERTEEKQQELEAAEKRCNYLRGMMEKIGVKPPESPSEAGSTQTTSETRQK